MAKNLTSLEEYNEDAKKTILEKYGLGILCPTCHKGELVDNGSKSYHIIEGYCFECTAKWDVYEKAILSKGNTK